MKILFKYSLIMLNMTAVFAMLIAYSSVYISPAKLWVPAIFGLAYPHILCLNVLFVLYWIFRRSKMAFLSLFVILAGYNYLDNYLGIKAETSDEKGIVICSYNVKKFAGPDDGTGMKENKERIRRFLENKNPDVVCLQEIDSSSIKGFNPFQSSSVPDSGLHSTIVGQKGNLIIFSRYPIIGKGQICFENTPNMIVFADLKINNDTFRIYNCHLQSYQFSAANINALNSISLEDQNQNFKKAGFLGWKLKRTFIERAEQVDHLKKQIQHSPYPVIVCGDFNDTPVSYAYQTVKGKLKDAFVESGTGTGNSYQGRLFSFRIDYILHSNVLDGYNFKVGKIDYSDHHPVSCMLIKKPK